MNILILSGSPRKGGNTDLLVEAFVKGASQKHHVEIVSVHDYKVNPCMGCNACFKNEGNICSQKDDMALIYEKANEADMLVIASPVYFYDSSDVLMYNFQSFKVCDVHLTSRLQRCLMRATFEIFVFLFGLSPVSS